MKRKRILLLIVVLLVATPFALIAQRQLYIRNTKEACEELRVELLAYKQEHGSYPEDWKDVGDSIGGSNRLRNLEAKRKFHYRLGGSAYPGAEDSPFELRFSTWHPIETKYFYLTESGDWKTIIH